MDNCDQYGAFLCSLLPTISLCYTQLSAKNRMPYFPKYYSPNLRVMQFHVILSSPRSYLKKKQKREAMPCYIIICYKTHKLASLKSNNFVVDIDPIIMPILDVLAFIGFITFMHGSV